MQIYPSDDGNAAFVRLDRGTDMLHGLNEAAADASITQLDWLEHEQDLAWPAVPLLALE